MFPHVPTEALGNYVPVKKESIPPQGFTVP